jgi:hypothetical protein
MKMTTLKFVFIMIVHFTFGTSCIFGQGCSDAGFCTINSFKPNSIDSVKRVNNQLKVGWNFGKADNAISVYGTYLEYNRQLNNRFGLDAKLTTLAQNGNGINTLGFSDIFFNTNYKASEKLNFTLGTKIPLSDASKKHNNSPLPMDYQASLGTWDLIFGIGYEIKKIQIVVAIQQPLTQNNNQFIATNYQDNVELSSFQSTNKFERSGDILLRVSYPINIASKLKLTPSILPIYHLTNDKYMDEFNVKKELIGSQGLTLNGTAYLEYAINSKNNFQLNLGMPFIVRIARPDGLTRSFIANLEYSIKF